MIDYNSGGFAVVKGECDSSLGKRKPYSIRHDTHSSEISITLCKRCFHNSDIILEANVWIKDDDGRTFAIHIGDSLLRELGDAINQCERKTEK